MTEPKQRRGLGRGLDALIVSTEGTDASSLLGAEGVGETQAAVRMLSTAAIQPNPHQPRTYFAEDALDELAASIRTHGVIQPLLVTISPQRPDLFWIIAGERRWRAAQMAGLESVPAIVREASEQNLVELALIENIQRADLHVLEEAAAYTTLMNDYHLTQAELSQRVGKSRPAIANIVRLLQAPPLVQQALVAEAISSSHARALLALEDDALTERALSEVLANELNVRQTEALVKRLQNAAQDASASPAADPAEDAAASAEVTRMEEGFRRALGTRVALTRTATGAGKLTIHFFNDSDLEAIYRQIAGDVLDE